MTATAVYILKRVRRVSQIPILAKVLTQHLRKSHNPKWNPQSKGSFMQRPPKAYRQGDVLLVLRKAVTIQPDAKILNHLVLAEGEVTGHSHKIDQRGADLFDQAGKKFLKVTAAQGAKLIHDEHGPQTLPIGEYEVIIQREYEPTGWRNVAD